MRDISVILCTHNPRRAPLQRALDSLRSQTMPYDKWELCLVDNGSTPPVSDWADLTWHRDGGRHVREDRLGLTWARLRGIRESSGSILVFVDDDNVLAPEYLERTFSIHLSAPHLGAWGAGQLTPEFETEPPAPLQPLLSMLALRSTSRSVWSSNPKDWSCIPWGAGLCVSRKVANAYANLLAELGVHEMFGRRGSQQQLWQGDDDLFSIAAVRSGLGFGVFPELGIHHLIASHRLTQKYFLRLIHDHALSHGILRYLVFGDYPRPLSLPAKFRIVLHGMRRGFFSMRCRWAAARGAHRAADFIRTNELKYFDLLDASTLPAARVDGNERPETGPVLLAP